MPAPSPEIAKKLSAARAVLEALTGTSTSTNANTNTSTDTSTTTGVDSSAPTRPPIGAAGVVKRKRTTKTEIETHWTGTTQRLKTAERDGDAQHEARGEDQELSQAECPNKRGSSAVKEGGGEQSSRPAAMRSDARDSHEFSSLSYSRSSDEQKGAAPKPYRGPSLRARALKMLSTRDFSTLELRRKLLPITAEMGHAPEQGALLVDALLADFTERGWQSDERFAASLARRRGKFGSARLAQELKSHQLSKETVTSTLGDAKLDEYQRAVSQWEKKFGSVATTPETRAKHLRFLIARGFSADIVRKVVSRGASPADEADDLNGADE
jgi:regulatory protein